eukprot:XP_014789615.1 PREDICTED: collagen alpha-1(XII) chain-like [Octopus bimaculoides]
MGRWLEISCFLLFLFYFSSQDSVYGNKIDMAGIKNAKMQGDAAPLDVPTDAKADIVFLVHMSKKSTKADQNLLKIFMRKLLSSADIDSGAVRVAIVTYNVNSKVVSNFDTYTSKADVFNTIDNMNKFKGPKANAAAGLKMVLNKISINKSGDRPNVKNTLIMVTDQKSNKVQNSKRNADKLRGKGTEIFTVGVGFDTSAELNEIANHPAGVHAQFVEDFSKLNEANDLLLQSIPSFNVMKKPVPRSTNRPAPVDNTIYQTSDELDLVFAIHISENVNDVEMRQLMNFLINMFGRANIAAGKVRVGVITYGETESVIFDLNEYNDATAMVQAISSTLTGSKSNKVNVANLLESVRTKMFQDAKGDRKGVPDALIILTDKISNMEVGEIPFQAAETQKKGIRVFTVGINLSDKAELETVASRPTDQNVFTVTSYSELPRTEQEIVNQLYHRRGRCHVHFSIEETYVEPDIFKGGKGLEVVDSIVYLGSMLNRDGTLDAEIKHRIVKTSMAFGKLVKQVQSDQSILIDMKPLFLQPCYMDANRGQLTGIILTT